MTTLRLGPQSLGEGPRSGLFRGPRAVSRDSEVFSINFIRREFLPLQNRRVVVYAALVYVLISTAILAGMIVFAAQSHSELRTIQKNLAREIPSKAAFAALTQDLTDLETRAAGHTRQLNTIAWFQKERLLAGEKLSALTETLPARTWVTQISGSEAQKSLSIQAVYLIDPKKPYDLPIKEWMEKLNAHPNFRNGLTRFDLGTTSRRLQGSSEICSFQLLAEWKIKGK